MGFGLLDCHISKAIFGNFMESINTGYSLSRCASFHFDLKLVC